VGVVAEKSTVVRETAVVLSITVEVEVPLFVAVSGFIGQAANTLPAKNKENKNPNKEIRVILTIFLLTILFILSFIFLFKFFPNYRKPISKDP